VLGALAGVLASLVMAAYAMIAAWVKGVGFFTSLYHIASLLISQDSMMASMQSGMAGNAFHFEIGPALAGAVIHMMTGAAYGALFGLAVYRFALGTGKLILAGLVWGLVVFLFSAFVGLPLAAGVLGSGPQIAHMAAMAGWGTFLVEHLLYGAVAGALLAVFVPRTSPAPA
jgi:hypothetical protein